MNNEVSLNQQDSVDPSYIAQFRLHLSEVRAHLAGADDEDLLPSFIPPTGYWTPSEKNVFFRSLSVHSRLRPDLVAATIGTKTVVDVCAYIDALDKTIARDRRLLLQRSDIPGAFEVSNAWVSREEKMAEDIISDEPVWEQDNILLQREDEVMRRKADTGEGTAAESWERDQRKHWRRKDALSKLECHHLMVIEGILKETEAGGAEVEESEPEDQDSGEAGPSPPSPVEPSDRALPTSVVSDGMIDPLLLQLSRIPVPDHPLIEGVSLQKHPKSLPHVEHPHETLPKYNAASSPPPPAPLVAQPLNFPRSPSPNADKDTGINQSDLSPASRRRIQKRLHMRRKRAAQRGERPIEVVAKLPPGRKAKGRRSASMPSRKQNATDSQLVQLDAGEGEEDTLMDVDQNFGETASSAGLKLLEGVDSDDEEDEGNDSNASPGHSKSGMTKPYKIKRDFAALGIDAHTLNDESLGLFHLSTLRRLMTLYKSGYDVKGSKAATAISADTIRLLSAILVEFVTEVIHRSIISREQENTMKAGIKVYHQTSNNVAAENVTHVLEMMGMVGLSKERYFAQLLEEEMLEAPEVKEAEDEEENDCGSEQTDEDDDETDSEHVEGPFVFPMLLPVHREVHPPLVALPKSLLPRAPARSQSSLFVDELLIPTETDEGELIDVLDEEMELDKADQVLGFDYEANLWKLFGR